MGARPWTVAGEAVVLTVRLTPKGGRDAIDGIEQLADGRPVLRMRVRAAPSGGDANAALVRVVADALGVAPRSVTLVGGHASRVKRVKIEGPSIALAAALEKIVRGTQTAGTP